MDYAKYKKAVEWGIAKGLITVRKITMPSRVKKEPKPSTSQAKAINRKTKADKEDWYNRNFGNGVKP